MPRSCWKALLALALAASLLFGAFMALMDWSQDELLFPTHAVAPPGPLPPGAERLSVDVPGGERLRGVHVPPAIAPNGPRTLVLGFGGNAWNGDDVASYLHELYPQADVVAFHYRGYAPSTGRPSAEALIADAPLVLDSALGRVEPQQIVAVGFSIGSAVAASLAKRSDLAGAILVTPFDSLRSVARELFPWLPVGLLFRHEMDAAGFLEGSELPVALVAAERDQIIPARRTQGLREKVPNLVFDRTVAGAGHNDIYARSDFQAAMRDALTAVSG